MDLNSDTWWDNTPSTPIPVVTSQAPAPEPTDEIVKQVKAQEEPVKQASSTAVSISDMIDIVNGINKEKQVSQNDVRSIDKIKPIIASEDYPIEYFTLAPTGVGYAYVRKMASEEISQMSGELASSVINIAQSVSECVDKAVKAIDDVYMSTFSLLECQLSDIFKNRWNDFINKSRKKTLSNDNCSVIDLLDMEFNDPSYATTSNDELKKALLGFRNSVNQNNPYAKSHAIFESIEGMNSQQIVSFTSLAGFLSSVSELCLGDHIKKLLIDLKSQCDITAVTAEKIGAEPGASEEIASKLAYYQRMTTEITSDIVPLITVINLWLQVYAIACGVVGMKK